MEEPKDFTRREEYEAPDQGYEPDRLLMCEEEIEVVNVASDKEEVSSANNEKSETEMNMGKAQDVEQYENEHDDVQEAEEDEVIEETGKGKKKGTVKRQSGNNIKPILAFAAVALLVGGAYIGYEMLSVPVTTPVFQPMAKPKTFPPENNTIKSAAVPVPTTQKKGTANDASTLVAEISNNAGQENNGLSAESKPQVSSLLPDTEYVAQSSKKIPVGSIDEDIKAIRNQLNDIIKSLGVIGEKKSAQQIADNEFSRAILKEMTTEIQEISAQNKALNDELAQAKKKIDELQASMKNREKEKKQRSVQKDKEQENTQEQKNSVNTSSWEILGFSGNRVIIADERGTHSVSVGQNFNGVKIISVDVESGAVKTSAGILKYGQ